MASSTWIDKFARSEDRIEGVALDLRQIRAFDHSAEAENICIIVLPMNKIEPDRRRSELFRSPGQCVFTGAKRASVADRLVLRRSTALGALDKIL